MQPASQNLRISRLIEKDVTRITELDLKPSPVGLIVLRGPNKTGKTAAIAAFTAALKGKRFDPEIPIRTGAERGEVEITLADHIADRYQVKVTWTQASRYLTVKELTPDGPVPVRKAQSLLKDLIGEVSFKPSALCDPKASTDEQLKILMAAIGQADSYEQAKARIKLIYDNRTGVNNTAKGLAEQMKNCPDPAPGKTLVQISPAEIQDQIETANFRNAKRTKLQIAITDAVAKQANIDAQIEKLNIQRRQAVEDEKQARAGLGNAPPAIEADALQEQLAKITEDNNNYAQQAQARNLADQHATAITQSESLTARISQEYSKMVTLLQASDLSKAAAGLTITNEGNLRYNDLPLSQASGQEQLFLGAMVAMRANPHLQVIAIDEGDRLDQESVKELAKIAVKYSYQFWMTGIYMTSADEAVSIIDLENGSEVGNQTPITDAKTGPQTQHETQAYADFMGTSLPAPSTPQTPQQSQSEPPTLDDF